MYCLLMKGYLSQYVNMGLVLLVFTCLATFEQYISVLSRGKYNIFILNPLVCSLCGASPLTLYNLVNFGVTKPNLAQGLNF